MRGWIAAGLAGLLVWGALMRHGQPPQTPPLDVAQEANAEEALPDAPDAFSRMHRAHQRTLASASTEAPATPATRPTPAP